MRLVEDTLSKMIVLYEDFKLRNYSIRSIWMFYKCYSIAINILGILDKKIKKRNVLFKKLVYHTLENNNYMIQKYETKLSEFMFADLNVIANSMVTLSEDVRESGLNKSTLWRKGVLGVAEYEFRENN